MELEHNISYEDFKSICRFCLKQDLMLKPIFKCESNDSQHQQGNDGDSIVHMVLTCVGLEINATDGLPKLICTECLHKLSASNTFRTQCLLSSACLTTIKVNHEYNKEYPQYNFESTLTEKNEFFKIDMDYNENDGKFDDSNDSSDCKNVINKKDEQVESGKDIFEEKNEIMSILKYENINKKVKELLNSVNKTNVNNKPKKKRKKYKKKPKPPVICPICGVMQTYLARHMSTHTGERKYKCNECDKAYSQVDALRMHKNLHTGEKPYKCDKCEKAFTNCHTLYKHKIVHTDERKYRCHLCVKTFRYTNSLTQHIRGHTEDRRYKCDQCSKMFLTRGVLNKHYLTHTGVREFQCELCPKAFQTKWHLTVHGKVHRDNGCGDGRVRKRVNHNINKGENISVVNKLE